MKIISKKTRNLTKKEIEFMNLARMNEYGTGSEVDFKKEDKNGEFIFVKDGNKIMAFGMMKPVKVKLGNKRYTIMGLGRDLSLEKRKGWGRKFNSGRISKLKALGKTGVAFTGRKNIDFFKKVGYNIEKNGIKKFRYLNPETKKLVKDDDGDMVYYEGKDRFITKLLNSKDYAITDTDFW